MSKLMKFFFSILCLCLILGCESKSGGGDDPDENPDTPIDTPAMACRGSYDCGVSQNCTDGQCVEKCADVPCAPDTGSFCETTTGNCIQAIACSDSEPCAGDFGSCEGGWCRGGLMSNTCKGAYPCMEGYNCVDGIAGSFCLNPCESVDECFLMARCLDPGPAVLASYQGHCFANLCRPGGDQFGVYQDVEWNTPCLSGEVDAGTCTGPISEGQDGEPLGICFRSDGDVPSGGSCDNDATHGDDGRCDGGMCLPDQATCGAFCELFDNKTCEAQASGNSGACMPVFGVRGLCIEGTASPKGAYESCAAAAEGAGLDCVDGYLCAASEGNTTGICLPFCDPDASAGATGSCDFGSCDSNILAGSPVEAGAICMMPECDTMDSDACPASGGGQASACVPLNDDGNTGFCVMGSGDLSAAGATDCAVGTGAPTCVDGYVCIPAAVGDTTGSCLAYCDPTPATAGQDGCDSGFSCQALTGIEPVENAGYCKAD